MARLGEAKIILADVSFSVDEPSSFEIDFAVVSTGEANAKTSVL